MEQKEDFIQEVVNLSSSDLQKLYDMAVKQIKDDREAGKDVGELEAKLQVIMDVITYRDRSKVSQPITQPTPHSTDQNPQTQSMNEFGR